MLEGLMVVAEDGPAHHRNHWRGGKALRQARTCHDQMTGRIAVGITGSLSSERTSRYLSSLHRQLATSWW
jgi:hypothetical protein